MAKYQRKKEHGDRGPRTGRGFWKWIGSAKFAVILLIILAVSSSIGMFIPQGASPQDYVGRYGQRAYELFRALRFTSVYHSGWFLIVLISLCLNLVVCSIRRFRLRRPRVGKAITHWSLVVIALGATVSAIWGKKGMLILKEGETAGSFEMNGRVVNLGFRLRLDDFIVERYGEGLGTLTARFRGHDWQKEYSVGVEEELVIGLSDSSGARGQPYHPEQLASYRVKVVRFVPDFVMDIDTGEVETRSNQPANPAILVSVSSVSGEENRWLFSRYPEMNQKGSAGLELTYRWEAIAIKQFKSVVTILDGDTVAKETIAVNDPLAHGGFTFYQATYDQERESWSGLQVSRDPGVPLVYAGSIILSLGLVIVFYAGPLLRNRGERKR